MFTELTPEQIESYTLREQREIAPVIWHRNGYEELQFNTNMAIDNMLYQSRQDEFLYL